MIIVDLETTGEDPNANAISSIGAVEFVNPQNTFYAEPRVGEDAELDPKALEITGFSKESLLNPSKPSLDEVLKSFKEWFGTCSSHILAGHNIWFDKAFLDTNFKKINEEAPYSRRTVDLHTLAYVHFIKEEHEMPMSDGHSKLDSDHIFRYIGLGIERGAHNALEDAKLTAEAFSRLLYDQPLIEEYKKFPIPWK